MFAKRKLLPTDTTGKNFIVSKTKQFKYDNLLDNSCTLEVWLSRFHKKYSGSKPVEPNVSFFFFFFAALSYSMFLFFST